MKKERFYFPCHCDGFLFWVLVPVWPTDSSSPSDPRGWRSSGLSWSWAAASAPRRRTCVSWDRTSPDPEHWTAPGRQGPARTSSGPGWTPGRWGWVCLWLRTGQRRETEHQNWEATFVPCEASSSAWGGNTSTNQRVVLPHNGYTNTGPTADREAAGSDFFLKSVIFLQLNPTAWMLYVLKRPESTEEERRHHTATHRLLK